MATSIQWQQPHHPIYSWVQKIQRYKSRYVRAKREPYRNPLIFPTTFRITVALVGRIAFGSGSKTERAIHLTNWLVLLTLFSELGNCAGEYGWDGGTARSRHFASTKKRIRDSTEGRKCAWHERTQSGGHCDNGWRRYASRPWNCRRSPTHIWSFGETALTCDTAIIHRGRWPMQMYANADEMHKRNRQWWAVRARNKLRNRPRK